MLKILLAPAAALYKSGVKFRNSLFDKGLLKSERFDIRLSASVTSPSGAPVRPRWPSLLSTICLRCNNVALLPRGYGRRTKGYHEVSVHSHYREVGDEPLQIKRKFPGSGGRRCEKRAEGIRRIQSEHPKST